MEKKKIGFMTSAAVAGMGVAFVFGAVLGCGGGGNEGIVAAREDGTETITPGRYALYKNFAQDGVIDWRIVGLTRVVQGNSRVECRSESTSFPTQTGLDVLPGEYLIRVRYPTAEGEKTVDSILDLR
jgi:hypothetical protein